MDLECLVMNVLLSRKCGKFLDYITKSLFYCSRILLSSASEKCNGKYKIFPLVLKEVLFLSFMVCFSLLHGMFSYLHFQKFAKYDFFPSNGAKSHTFT